MSTFLYIYQALDGSSVSFCLPNFSNNYANITNAYNMLKILSEQYKIINFDVKAHINYEIKNKTEMGELKARNQAIVSHCEVWQVAYFNTSRGKLGSTGQMGFILSLDYSNFWTSFRADTLEEALLISSNILKGRCPIDLSMSVEDNLMRLSEKGIRLDFAPFFEFNNKMRY
ncbi:Hypothetical protein ORPV_739 [Orpheovirus IHUMI-LCC2]|uniref:Uncharacterized protein n=1 Tax=Orpheovirus IHUMI-LCC2 TaxID=2023057 RepID=A0A2I2L532_9VIRU|nr:Hypothetical protein ORPV_739 [Orpheovirus IHUMI-LCC2]SNW62643.1 Hypothetical protein ORPV_739 [Orpheovirus IHUMI-LCC2]